MVSDSDPAPKLGRKNCLPASQPEIQTFQDYNYLARPAHGPASPWSHRSRPGGSRGEGAAEGWQKGGLRGSLSQRGGGTSERGLQPWGGGGKPQRRSHRSPRVPSRPPLIQGGTQASWQACAESQDSVGGALLHPRKAPGLHFSYPGLPCPS